MWLALRSVKPKGLFTPAEHSLRTFENVSKRSRTFANMLFTPPEPHLRAVVLKHSTLFPPWHPGYQKLSICAASIVILTEIEKRRHRKKRRMWESSYLKGRNYVQLLEKFKGGWHIHMLFTLEAQQTLNLFEHSQVYRQAAGPLRTLLNRVRKPYSARASVYTKQCSTGVNAP